MSSKALLFFLSFFLLGLPTDSFSAPVGRGTVNKLKKKAAKLPQKALEQSKIQPILPKKSEIELLRDAAVNGDAQAQYKLAEKLYEGSGAEKNVGEAAQWFKKSAEAGNARAQLQMSRLALSGEGVARNAAEAREWALKAADQGDAEAKDILEQTAWQVERAVDFLSQYVPAQYLRFLRHPLITENARFIGIAGVLLFLLALGKIIRRPFYRAFLFALFLTPVYLPDAAGSPLPILPFLWSCYLGLQNSDTRRLAFSAASFLLMAGIAFAYLSWKARKAEIKIISQIPP